MRLKYKIIIVLSLVEDKMELKIIESLQFFIRYVPGGFQYKLGHY